MIASRCHARAARASFTLVELLITISIIAIMASMMLFALYSAQESAKVDKTKALIARLDAIIKTRWESYRTRRVPVVIPPGTPPLTAATTRLNGLHELMRMEMPDRWSDIMTVTTTAPYTVQNSLAPIVTLIPPSSVWRGYVRKVQAAFALNPPKPPTLEFQNAECLYMIVMSALAEEGDARDVFKPDDVKNVDGDGFPEFVDAWGQPIRFLRWAPGLQSSELQILNRGTVGSTAGAITVNGANFPADGGAYIGGVLMPATGANGSFDTTKAVQVIGYTSPGGRNANFQVAPPALMFSAGDQLVMMARDPFDPLGVYGNPPRPAVPSFATYPLIYSSGPDRCYGITSDDTIPIGAASPNLNPFKVLAATGELLGNATDISTEPNYVPSGWLDNIHNHMLGTR
jgi:type II secretory pathway pseudopilin PulG